MNSDSFKNFLINSSEYHRREKVIQQKFPHFFTEVIIEKGNSFSEKLFQWTFKKSIPICPICNINETKFINFIKGYSNVCSEKCSGLFYLKIRSEGRKKSCLKKYGVENVSQIESVKEKVKQTNLEKRGVENVFQSKEIQQKSLKTLKERNINEVLELEKNGIAFTNVSQLPSYKEKFTKTINKKYGINVNNPFQADEVKEKICQTNLERYGVKHSLQRKEIRSKQANSNKISSLEKKLIEILTNNNILFQHQYYIEKNEVVHTFDFAVFDNENLICLIDTDGVYFHGYLNDQDGKRIYTEYDSIRTAVIPKNVKFIAIIESDFENGIKELFNTLTLDYDQYITDLFNWCRSISFPYPKYADKILHKSYNELIKYDKFYLRSQIGFNIIRHFHKSIYHAFLKNKKSPYDAWHDDSLILKAIKNRLIYKNNIDPSRVLEGFNISKIAPKVSVFKPTIAKNLILKYLNNYNTIFDPFSGFSGRMLGTASLCKKYIGQDLNKTHIEESKKIVNFLNLQNITLNVKSLQESVGEYECLFTCPPYDDKEKWNDFEVFKTCDEWIDICLTNFKCQKYLFVVDDTIKYKNNIVEILENKSHFGINEEYVLLFDLTVS